MTAVRPVGGSRFLYDSFSSATARIDANERVAEVQFSAIATRLDRIEALMERMERRLWLTIYGIVAVLLSRAALSLLNATTG